MLPVNGEDPCFFFYHKKNQNNLLPRRWMISLVGHDLATSQLGFPSRGQAGKDDRAFLRVVERSAVAETAGECLVVVSAALGTDVNVRCRRCAFFVELVGVSCCCV